MKFKGETTVKMLERLHGGKWKYYAGPGLWGCNDGIRKAWYVSIGVDVAGECDGSRLCIYYSDGRAPQWV